MDFEDHDNPQHTLLKAWMWRLAGRVGYHFMCAVDGIISGLYIH